MTEPMMPPQMSEALEAATIAKLQAEILDLEAARAVKLEDAKIKAAEAKQKEAHAEAAVYGAETMRVQTASTLRQEKINLAANHYYHEYMFTGGVDYDNVETCLAQLAVWHRMDPECDMHIIMNSPGGSVIDGMHLFDQLVAYSIHGKGTHHTKMTVRGYAASMAGILLQAVDERVIGPESYLMIHEISSMTMGKIGEIKDEVKWMDRISDRVADIFVKRAKGKITLADFKKNWNRTDWWMDSKEALDNGFVDRIG